MKLGAKCGPVNTGLKHISEKSYLSRVIFMLCERKRNVHHKITQNFSKKNHIIFRQYKLWLSFLTGEREKSTNYK